MKQALIIRCTSDARAENVNKGLLEMLITEENCVLTYTSDLTFKVECDDAKELLEHMIMYNYLDPTQEDVTITEKEDECVHVDFVGRWILKASVEQLNEKLIEYADKAKEIAGRDAQLAFYSRERIKAELKRRSLVSPAD